MQSYYLRIEAVNLANFIEDTEQLSIIRGGGLLLLRAMEKLGNEFARKEELEEISTGASSGLFTFSVETPEDACLLCREVEQFFHDREEYQYATFVVDFEPRQENGFRQSLERVIARNRWRQYRQPTLITPDWNTDPGIHESDFSDRLRPAPHTVTVRRDQGIVDKNVSPDAKIRHNYGRRQKKREFYQEEIKNYCGVDIEDTFTNDLQELTCDAPAEVVRHKMAVIYADGNSFGALQAHHCRDDSSQKNFDRYLKEKRAGFLKELLEQAQGNSLFTTNKRECKTNQDKQLLQIETLMWGGDELLLVVPAWQGWNTLSLLYQHVKTWSFGGDPLYHGAGLVFCHHNAPIHRITRLAKELAEEAKSKDRKKNLFQYCVLESFDYIGRELSRYRRDQFPGLLADTPFSLNGEEMENIIAPFSHLKNLFPRRKAYALARAAVQDGREKRSTHYQAEIDRVDKVVGQEARDSVTTLAAMDFFGNTEGYVWPPGMWLHLVELWDFIDSSYLREVKNG